MNEDQNDNSELIEVALALLEKSKQQDESIQKAIKALESEKNAIEGLRSDFARIVVGKAGEVLERGLKTPVDALNAKIDHIGSVTNELKQAKNELKRDLNWQNGLFYFGGFGLLVAIFFIFALLFIPSLDEITSRRNELNQLNEEIESMKGVKNLHLSHCNKKICVRVDPKQCNYGDDKARYCIAK